jgi:thymidylate kinase
MTQHARSFEILGPKAVGKSTIGPIVAERLGVHHYAGIWWRTLGGCPVSDPRRRVRLIVAIASSASLFLRAFVLRGGAAKARFSYAANICGRNYMTRYVVSVGGVISGGTAHGICEQIQVYGSKVETLARHVQRTDFYIVLHARTEDIRQRFTKRQVRPGRVIDELEARLLTPKFHDEGVARYVEAVPEVLGHLGGTIICVEATGSPTDIADRVVARIMELEGQ